MLPRSDLADAVLDIVTALAGRRPPERADVESAAYHQLITGPAHALGMTEPDYLAWLDVATATAHADPFVGEPAQDTESLQTVTRHPGEDPPSTAAHYQEHP